MRQSIPPITKNLLIINGLFFLATFVFNAKGIDLRVILGAFYPESPNFNFWQILTHRVMFLLVMFFSPLVAIVPPYATAGALIFVGVLMTSSLARVNWDDFTESVPAFITTVMMPFTFSITEGIALGFMSYCIMKVCTGRWRDLNLCVVVVAALFALKIILVD